MMMKHIRLFFTGILINIQFLTSIPVKKNFSLDKKELTYALQTFPILGLIQGFIYAGIFFGLDHYFPFSDVLNALILWLMLIILTGGIHLDGWIDTSDAYFSYKDAKRRLEVMEDPRVGAFGVLSVVVFLIVRFIVLYEWIRVGDATIYVAIIVIPFLGKMLTASLLQGLPLAKEKGMASFLRQGKSSRYHFYHLLYLILVGAGIAYLVPKYLLVYCSFILVAIIVRLGMGSRIKRNFNGISGDTLGAGTEGMELILWMTGLALHFFVTG